MKTTTAKDKDGSAAIWGSEPDAHDFVDKVTGYRCAMRRNSFGAWCGYIEVPADHPWHGKDYSDVVTGSINPDTTVDEVGIVNVFCAAGKGDAGEQEITLLVRAHGGLTYAGRPWRDKSDNKSWWFGFDCSHSGDLSPKLDRVSPIAGEVYRDMAYVIEVCERAAADLYAAAKAEGR